MKTLSLSEAKLKLGALVDLVRNTDQEIVITKNGRPMAVLVSPDKFDGWKETIEIRRDTALMGEIEQGLAALKTRAAKIYTLEELFKETG